jgi:hypothetical protein
LQLSSYLKLLKLSLILEDYHLTHYLKLELIFEDFHMITIIFLSETAEGWSGLIPEDYHLTHAEV